MPGQGAVLIVGADGLIGSALSRFFGEKGRKVLATSRRATAEIRLDLNDDLSKWRPPSGVRQAFICAAVTRLAICRSDPAGSHAVNVRGGVAVARALAAEGARVVVLSSDKVFDGSRPRRSAGDPHSPITEYGRQKSALERGVAGIPGVCVARLTKVLAPGHSPFDRWLCDMREGRSVRAFRDMTLAPVDLDSVVAALAGLAGAAGEGVYQFSGAEDLSYYEAARRLASSAGVDPSLVVPEEASSPPEERPPYTSLDCSRAEAEFEFTAPNPEFVLEQILISSSDTL